MTTMITTGTDENREKQVAVLTKMRAATRIKLYRARKYNEQGLDELEECLYKLDTVLIELAKNEKSE